MEKGLVTVFIPMYNSEKYIKKCLESVLNQTYRNLDILVIDDGSVDRSYEIVNQYKDNRIRILKNKENKGIPYTRNRGLKEARGEYIALIDSDDYSCLDRIEKQVEYMDKNQEIIALGTNYIISRPFISRKIKKNRTPQELKIGLLFECQLANPTVMLRNNVLKDHGITYNEDCFVAQDYELWTQITKIGDIDILPEFLHTYRSGHENITSISISTKLEKRKKIIDSIHNNLLDYYNFPLNTKQKAVFNTIFFDAIPPFFTEKLLQESIEMFKVMNRHIIEEQLFSDEIYINVLNNILITRIALTKHSLFEKYKIIRIFIKNDIIKKMNILRVVSLHFQQLVKEMFISNKWC